MTTFDDVLLKPQLGVLPSRAHADIDTILGSTKLRYPFLAAPMPALRAPAFIVECCRLGASAVTDRFQDIDSQIAMGQVETRAWNAIGLDVETFVKMYSRGLTKFCVDVAHGHSLSVAEFFERVNVPDDTEWIIGNVATAEGARFLLDNTPACAIKVGIGPGSVCTTREVSGHGVPQLTAINDVADEVRGAVSVIADGGIRNSGDIVKAIAAGADVVMMGRMFAHSVEANTDTYEGCASFELNGHRAPEGISVTITEAPEYTEHIIKRMAWGLRSGISYSGARNLAELQERAQFIPVTGATQAENAAR